MGANERGARGVGICDFDGAWEIIYVCRCKCISGGDWWLRYVNEREGLEHTQNYNDAASRWLLMKSSFTNLKAGILIPYTPPPTCDTTTSFPCAIPYTPPSRRSKPGVTILFHLIVTVRTIILG
jgi:hypothetical protein